ncbi:uncharacterized protein C8orf58 homolog [Leptodactylus fuscus]|uniref:uncharacterized protein C8orf58 homolog n=1 Tax=Leptodactylus fuscus TaxID=238119 RepID=UPI003F4E7E29
MQVRCSSQIVLPRKMLGRSRKLTFGTLCNEGSYSADLGEVYKTGDKTDWLPMSADNICSQHTEFPHEHSEGCVLLRSTPVDQRLMDSTLHCPGPAVSHFSQRTANHGASRGCINGRKRFEKSESEDSGVELPPPSPYGSESSYSPEESESLESSTPEYSESPDSPTSEDPESPKRPTTEIQAPLVQSKETVIMEHSTGSFGIHSAKDVDPMERLVTQQRERELSGVPHKLEQAIIRSRRQRSSSKESIQNRTARNSRKYVGSIKEQRRGRTFSCEARSPTRPCQENKDQDPLHLPGDGLHYLENLCQMLEKIAELQQKNQRLQRDKKEAERRIHNQVLFLDSCVCGTSPNSRDSDSDVTDNPQPNEKTWEPKHYRKRSGSHAGVLLSVAKPTDNGLKVANKMDPKYVSVPNLQEGEQQRLHRNYKAEAPQWYKVKDMLSRLTGKSQESIHRRSQAAEPGKNCRYVMDLHMKTDIGP